MQGLVLDPQLEPLPGAEVSFHHAENLGLAWLPATEAPTLSTRTDERGRYTIAGAAGPGCLLVRHPTGLGALVTGAAPGAPDRVLARPLGEVRIDAADAPTTIHAAAALNGGDQQYLGGTRGAAVRLPAGAYRLWIQSGARWSVHTCRVEEGRTAVLPPPPPGRRVTLPPDFDGAVHLRGWPQVELGRTPLRIPESGGPAVLRITRRTGNDEVFDQVWWAAGAADATLELPDLEWAEVRVLGPDGSPLPGARIYTLEPAAQEPWVRARSTTDGDGRGRWGRIEDGRVLVVAGGMALRLLDGETLARRPEVRLTAGCTVSLRVTGAAPGETLPVELRQSADRWLVRTALTDRRGHARFDHLAPGRAVLRLRSPSYLPAELAVSLPTDDVAVLRADPGASLAGRVVLAGEEPAAGAVVSLRDPSGRAAAPPRTAVTDRQGRFAFSGLPDEELFTVSAELQRDGRTWSAQVRGLQPGTGEASLELRLEDPPPPHRRKR